MKKGRRKYLLSVGLLILYLVFQAGITVFPHVHIVNGEKLVHSHPYSSANHNHSSDQLTVIARLSSIQTLKAESVFCQDIELPMLYAMEFSNYSFELKDAFLYGVGLRAPPFC